MQGGLARDQHLSRDEQGHCSIDFDQVVCLHLAKPDRNACVAAVSSIFGVATRYALMYVHRTSLPERGASGMDDISKFSRFVRVHDPAVIAWKKVPDAGEDDAAYEIAIIDFENAVPITPRGVTLKTKLLWLRLRALFEGDRLTQSGTCGERHGTRACGGASAARAATTGQRPDRRKYQQYLRQMS